MKQPVAILLLDWLRTGLFGPLRFGQTRAETALLLGPPDDVGGISRKYPRPTIWKYGDFELYFWLGDDGLSAVLTDTFTIPHGGPRIQIAPWHLRNGIAQRASEEALTSADIAYRTAVPAHLVGTTQIITASRVWLNFEAPSMDIRGVGGLCAMGQSARTVGP